MSARPDEPSPTISVRSGAQAGAQQPPAAAAAPPANNSPAAETHTFAPDLTGAPLKQAVLHGEELPQIPGYQLLEYVATGGMGIVYRGRDQTLDREVAIKLPRAGFLGGEHDKERFVREARAAARLRHPNICPIFEVREAQHRPYIAMAFIQGQTLKEWAKATSPGPRQIAELVATVARAVQAAHDEGVIHRDLKPSNIMVEQGSGEPILMDFGLAKDLSQTDGLTISGDLVGTPAYMAPEQATGRVHDIGPLTDVYALGAILYELLTGRMPFEGTLAEVLQKVQQAEPESIRRSNLQVHRDLETICVKAMSKRTLDRYRSAGALADDLERFARGEPILARRQAVGTRIARQIQKYPVVWSLVAALLVALGLGTVTLPRVWRGVQVNNLGRRLETSLRSSDWDTTRVPEAEAILSEIEALSPTAAEDYRTQLVNRLDEHVADYITNRPRLTEADRLQIDADIEILKRFAPALAAKRGPEADRRFGLWQRTVDWRPPFADTGSVLPGLEILDGGGALGATTAKQGFWKAGGNVFLATQPSGRRQQVEATFECPPGATCGVLLNARQLPPGGIGAVAVSADSQRFATAHTGGGAIHLWNSETGDEVQTLPGHERGIGGLAFTPDGKYLLSTGLDGKLHVWNLASGKLHRSAEFEIKDFGKDTSAFHAPPLALSGDGAQAFVGTALWGKSGAIRRWSVPDLAPLDSLVHPSQGICRLSYSDAAKRLAAGTAEGDLQVWDVAEARLLYTTHVHDRSITALAIRPDGAQVALTSSNGLVRVYDGQEPKLLASLQGFEAGVYALAWRPQAGTLAAGYEAGMVKVWNVETRQVVGTLFDRRRRCLSLAFEPQGRWGIAGSEMGTATVWDASSATARWSLGNQSYAFLVEREANGSVARLRIQRNGTPLRDVSQQISGPSLQLRARREGERLTLQVNQNPAVTFLDYFPSRPVERGVWGLQLAEASRLTQLTVRGSLVAEDASPLEIGDQAFRAGLFAEALEKYEQQIAASVAEEQESIRQEAALKAASCLVRLNRLDDAIGRFKGVCTASDSSTAVAKLAHFQLWLLYLHLGQFEAAEGLAQSIPLKYPQAAIAEVVPSDLGDEIFWLYLKSIARRRSVLEPGNLARVATTLRVADYFQLEGDQTQDLAWHALTAYRINGRDREARELGQRELDKLLKLPHRFDLQANGAGADSSGVLGFLCRWLDCPGRIEQPLDAMLFGEGTKFRPEVQGPAVASVVERARLHAHRGDWERSRSLLQMAQALDPAPIPPHTRVALALMRGFAERRLGRAAEAEETFQRALEDAQVRGLALDTDQVASTELVPLLLLASLGGMVDEDFAQRFFTQLKSRLETVSGADQLFVQLPPTAKQMREMWRTKKGWELGEQIALGNLLVAEQVKAFLTLLARQMIRQGSVGEQASDEQDELLWQLCVDGFEAFSARQLSLPTFLQLGLAWKEIPPPLGWSFFFQGLPSHLRAPIAYALGKRFQAKKNAAEARTLLTYAKDFSGEASLARKLAEEALADPALAP